VEDAEAVVLDVAQHVTELDAAIAEAVEHWRPERIGVIEQCILRLALRELVRGETPPKVAISEAVRLARWFAGAKAPGFVNGVLDALARRAGRL
jgi:N utilization substance protein B